MDDLISRKALLEQECFMDDDNGFRCSVVFSADVRRAPAVDAVTKWISVKERLPERNKRILVAFKGGMVTTSMCINEASCFLFENDYGKVTHWMPLPEPPKEV